MVDEMLIWTGIMETDENGVDPVLKIGGSESPPVTYLAFVLWRRVNEKSISFICFCWENERVGKMERCSLSTLV
jgi:hypothetical protein